MLFEWTAMDLTIPTLQVNSWIYFCCVNLSIEFFQEAILISMFVIVIMSLKDVLMWRQKTIDATVMQIYQYH